MCPRLNKDRDCQDTDIQQKCKKLCGLCPGEDIYLILIIVSYKSFEHPIWRIDIWFSLLLVLKTEPVKCEDKSFLCKRIDKATDCTDVEVQQQCPKVCDTCQGTYN